MEQPFYCFCEQPQISPELKGNIALLTLIVFGFSTTISFPGTDAINYIFSIGSEI